VRDSIIASQGFADFFDSIGQKRSSRSRSAASLELDRSVRGGADVAARLQSLCANAASLAAARMTARRTVPARGVSPAVSHGDLPRTDLTKQA
jgi:hypothetical protein